MKKAKFINALYITAGLVLALLIGGAGAYVYLRGTYKPSTKCANESHSVREQQTSDSTANDVIDSNTRNNSTDAPACTKGTLKTYTNEHLGDFSFDYLDTDWTLTETTTPKGAGQEYLPDDILITLASKHDDGKIEITMISNDNSDGGGPRRCTAGTPDIDYDTFGNIYSLEQGFRGWVRHKDPVTGNRSQQTYDYVDRIVPISHLIELYKRNPEGNILDLDMYVNDVTGEFYTSIDDLPEIGYCTSYNSISFLISSDIHLDSPYPYGTDNAVFTVRIQYTGPDIKSAEKVFKTIGGLQ